MSLGHGGVKFTSKEGSKLVSITWIESEKLIDLVELTEEKDITKTIIRALGLYYEVQKFRSKEYRLSLIPFHSETGEIDKSRAPIYLNDIDDIV